MTIEQLGRRIGLPDGGIACAQRAMPKEEQARRMLALLETDEESFLKEICASASPNQLALALLTRYAAQQAPRWLARGLPEDVCYDTLGDIAVWYRECVRRTGEAGVVEWDWLLYPLKGRLYRLGRLQYQPRTLREPLRAGSRTYPAGTPVLEVHIPADGRLEREAAADSFRKAREFFVRAGTFCFTAIPGFSAPRFGSFSPPHPIFWPSRTSFRCMTRISPAGRRRSGCSAFSRSALRIILRRQACRSR